MKHVKQTLAILLTLLMLVTAVPFTVFGATCEHNFIDKQVKPEYLKTEATCSSKAVYYKTCQKCHVSAKDIDETKTFVDENSALNPNKHPEDKIKVSKEAKEPTCKAFGCTAERTCEACRAIVEYSDPIPRLDYHVDASNHKPTCGSNGGITCKWCGEQIPADPANHPADKIVDMQTAVPATCTQNGTSAGKRCTQCNTVIEPVAITTKDHEGGTATCTKKAVCTVCHQEYGEVNPNKHDLKEVAAVAASCVDPGNKQYWECKDCHKFFSDAQGTTEITDKTSVVIAAVETAHKNLKKVPAKASTCSATGNTEHWYCSACNNYYSDAAATQKISQTDTVVAKKDHTWGKMTLKTGSCTAGGTAEHECSVCHTKEDVTITAGQHPADAQKTTKGKAATCTEDGTTDQISCELCGTVIQASTVDPKKGHDYEGAKATGKGDGTHTLTCNRCKQPGDAIPCTDEDSDCKCDVCGQQLAHVFTNWVSDGNATCAEDGTKTAICDKCHKAKNTITDEGSKADAQHQYDWTVLNDATCIANGHRKGVCKVCGAEVMEEIADTALGHVESDWQYPDGFDCEVGGNRFKLCTRCGQPTATEPIEGRAHTPVIDPEVTKTCTVDGKTAGKHCDVCGKILTPQIIFPAQGHKADANGFTVTKAATCTEAGEQTAICGVCGDSFTEAIPARGHTYVDTVVPPTCEGAGYTLHKCSVCGAQYKENITSATGHKMVQKIRPATTEENGKVVLTCSVCGKKQADKVYRIKKIALSQTTFARDSKKHKPSITITDTKGNTLTKNVDYKLKYSSGLKAVGTYKVVITFMGEYSGKVTRKFKIVPPIVKSVKVAAGKGSAALSWAQNKFADVYVVYCATEKNGKYKKLGTTTKLNFTATKLASGKVYYFKVAAVRKLDSGNYYSADFSIKKAKIK